MRRSFECVRSCRWTTSTPCRWGGGGGGGAGWRPCRHWISPWASRREPCWCACHVQFSNNTGYPSWKGTVMSGEQLLELLEGMEANDLLSGYTHLLTGAQRFGGVCHCLVSMVPDWPAQQSQCGCKQPLPPVQAVGLRVVVWLPLMQAILAACRCCRRLCRLQRSSANTTRILCMVRRRRAATSSA